MKKTTPIQKAVMGAFPLAVFGNNPITEQVASKYKDEAHTLEIKTLRYMSAADQVLVFKSVDSMEKSILAASLSFFADWINATPHAKNIAKDDKAFKAAFRDWEKAAFPQGLYGSYRQAKTAVKSWLAKDDEALTGDHVLCTADGDLTPLRILKSWTPQAEKPTLSTAEKAAEMLEKDSDISPQGFLQDLASCDAVSGVDLLMAAVATMGEGKALQILLDRKAAREAEAKQAEKITAAAVKAA